MDTNSEAQKLVNDLTEELESVQERISQTEQAIDTKYEDRIDKAYEEIAQLRERIGALEYKIECAEEERDEEIAELVEEDESRAEELKANLKVATERLRKETLLDSLGELALEFSKKPWTKQETKPSYLGRTKKCYGKRVVINDQQLMAKLEIIGTNYWCFTCAVGAKSFGNAVYFKGTLAEAKAFAVERVDKRLIHVKKHLLKQLS